jgi:hypothetical protein
MTIDAEKALAFMKKQREYQSAYRKRVRLVARAAKEAQAAQEKEARAARDERLAREFYRDSTAAYARGVPLLYTTWLAEHYPEGV